MGEITFNTDEREDLLITKIVNRAADEGLIENYQRMSLHMDIAATHCNGCMLDLERLLGTDGFNFAHDVLGIKRHINRTNGRLEHCFLPRFALKLEFEEVQ